VTPLPAPPPRLEEPLPDLESWVRHLRAAEIPVLRNTAESLEALRAHEDGVDANTLGELIANDPLMTLKVLVHAATHRGRRVVTDAETVTSALVLMGISPFFAAFPAQPDVETWLADKPAALAGLNGALRRAHRGANFALAFAVQRMDPDAAAIYTAALLHDFADMLLWCQAPTLALRLQALYREQPALRYRDAQREVLKVELAPLHQALMKAWGLPALLIRIADDRHSSESNARCVALGLRLARHTADGWSDASIPHDIAEIATLLHMTPAHALELVQEI